MGFLNTIFGRKIFFDFLSLQYKSYEHVDQYLVRINIFRLFIRAIKKHVDHYLSSYIVMLNIMSMTLINIFQVILLCSILWAWRWSISWAEESTTRRTSWLSSSTSHRILAENSKSLVLIWQLLSIKENICAERHRKSYALQDTKK